MIPHPVYFEAGEKISSYFTIRWIRLLVKKHQLHYPAPRRFLRSFFSWNLFSIGFSHLHHINQPHKIKKDYSMERRSTVWGRQGNHNSVYLKSLLKGGDKCLRCQFLHNRCNQPTPCETLAKKTFPSPVPPMRPVYILFFSSCSEFSNMIIQLNYPADPYYRKIFHRNNYLRS